MAMAKKRTAAEASKPAPFTASKPVSAASKNPVKAAKPKLAKPKQLASTKPKAVETISPSSIGIKLKRRRFTMPQVDFDRMTLLKHRARELGRPTRKNELLRAGLRALVMLTDESLMLALSQLEPVKSPKPAKVAKKRKVVADS